MPHVRIPAAVMAACLAVIATVPHPRAQAPAFFPLEDVRPGMVAVGRTVFADGKLDEFRAQIIGVLRNTIGPRRDLVLARLEGGPLAQTGVMQGMSGSPVYIDGRLLGAVSYSLGSFPREPIAGITPIAEMLEAVDGATGRSAPGGLSLEWPANAAAVFGALRALSATAASPLAGPRDVAVVGPAGLADLLPSLRPIGTAFVMGGLDPTVGGRLAWSGGGAAGAAQTTPAQNGASDEAATLRPGDAVGMSLLRGDIEMGATGTVTHVDGGRVYAFGHPFLNLGTTQMAMTKAHVYTVLPSLDSSMKIASLGPVIGVMGQDRTTAVGGRLGARPEELDISIAFATARGGERTFRMQALHDPALTPLFAFVAIFNTVISYERQNGELSMAASGSVTFGDQGRVEFDDFFTGDGVASAVSGALSAAIGTAATNEFRPVLPTALDIRLRASEAHDWSTIERAWLDTVRPRAGETHTLHVELRRHRGGLETVTFPITMPTHAAGPLKLVVADGAALGTLERQEIRPGRPTSWPALLSQLQAARAGNRIYVRLTSGNTGVVVGGEALPGLPQSVRTVLDADGTGAQGPVARTVLGAWERRFDRAIRGSREVTITLLPAH